MKNNVFILHDILPSTPIECWDIHELCYLHDQQVINKGDEKYIFHIKCLITEKVTEQGVADISFFGDGCCSEYRNSLRFQIERLKEIIK